MKKALSLFLALVMVALMLPVSAIIASAADEETTPFDIGDTASVYSVDFSKVKSDADLASAGWSFLAKSGTSPIAPQYKEDGVRYVTSDAAQLVLGAFQFSNTEDYVVDYTFKFASRFWIFENSFVFQNATEFNGSYDGAAYKFRAAEVAADSCWTDGSQIFVDKALTTHANSTKYQPDAEYSKKATEDFVDCRVRIIVRDGVTQYAIYTIADKDFYLMKEDAITIADGSMFGFCHIGGDGEGERGVLLKNFSIYKAYDGYAPGRVFYHTDLTTLADLSNGQTYSGADLDAALAKAGMAVTADSDATALTQLYYGGLVLGGADQGVKLTSATNLPEDVVNGKVDYVVKATMSYNSGNTWWVKFGTDAQSPLEGTGFSWKTPDVGATDGCKISNFTAYDITGTTTIDSPYSTLITEDAKYRSYYEMSIVVDDGKITDVYMTIDGNTVRYKANSDLAVTGYFRFYHTGWGGGKSTTVREIKVYAGGYGDDANFPTLGTYYKYDASAPAATYTPGQVLHNVNMANVSNKADLGYDFITDKKNSDVWLEDGALAATLSNPDSFIKLDSDKIFPAGMGSYTLEFDLKFHPRLHIFFVAFGLNDKADFSFSTKQGDDKRGQYGWADWDAFKFRGKEEAAYECDSATAYIYDEDAAAWVRANSSVGGGMPQDVIDALADGAYANVQIPVNNHILKEVYITVGETVVKVVRNDAIRIVAGDIGFTGSGVGDGAIFAIKSIRVTAGTNYDALVWGDNAENATIVDNQAQAYVYVNDVLTEVAAGTTVVIADYAEDAVAVMTADGAKAAADFVAEAGKGYEIITKADIADFAVGKGGTDLRLGSNPGIRFKTSFARRHWGAYAELLANGVITEFKMGTLITVKGYRDAVDEFTAEKLAAYGESVGKNVYMDVVADASELYSLTSFAGSVIGVKDLTREYVAVGYITVTYADGTSNTFYSGEQTASVVGFANAIVEADEPNFDGYTEAEVEALKYIAALDDVAA